MGTMKKSLGGSIHRIREFELEKVNLSDEFDILQIVGEGWFGKILLVEHKATDSEMVLKALPKPYTALKDFYREFHYGLHLGAHKNIITTYDVSFETAGFYVFSQEYAPLGDLTSNVSDTGIGELHTKRVAKQLAAALDHLHSRDLVHRDVKLDNILVFKSDFSRIKLCDFGETRRVGSMVPRRNEWLPYAPPEVLLIESDHNYRAHTTHDVWQFAIVIFVCLTGCLPWQKAAPEDPRYGRYLAWHTNSMLKRQPKLFRLVASRAQRLFRKYLEPRPEKRPAGLAEMHRFLDDRWHSKAGIRQTAECDVEEEGLCPSMYSFHSSVEEKNKLLHSLTQYGLETTVDRGAKKDRIKDWIQSSVIEEEDETRADASNTDGEADSDAEHAVVGRGPVTNMRVPPVETNHNHHHHVAGTTPTVRRRVSMRSERNLPPIDPRIPLEQQKDKIKAPVLNNNTDMGQVDVVETVTAEEDDTRVNFEAFGIHIQTALPFQNIRVNHQAKPAMNNNLHHHGNGTVASGGKSTKQYHNSRSSTHDEKRYGAYRGHKSAPQPPTALATQHVTSKSSSSNSNSTERSSAGRR